jgi:iron complex transport system permease protein
MALGLALAVALVLSVLTGPGSFGLGGDARWLILSEIRVPRALLGALVGGVLGLAGAALQGYLRNPLAEPGVLGISSGAAFGAVTVIHLGLAQAFPLALPLAGLAGAAAATVAVLSLAGPRSGPVALLLAGVAVSTLAVSLTSVALNLSRNPFAAAEMVFWLMGSLADRSMTQLLLAAPLMLGGMYLLLRVGHALDALTLGEETAQTLGIDLDRTRLCLVGGAALGVGAATAVTGIIGFVGLVVPHLLRPYVGHLPSKLLVASLLGGALLVVIADVFVRLVAPVVDLRIGVLTALLGAPFFLWLVVRLREAYAP